MTALATKHSQAFGDDWNSKSLGDVCRPVGGGTPSRSQPNYWNGNTPWASVKDFSDDSLVLAETQEHITQEGLESSASTLIPSGTPVICTRMAVGRCAVTTRPTAINQDLKALPLSDDFELDFFIRLLRFHAPDLDRVSIGSTVRGITTKDLLKLPLRFPQKPHQARIAAVLYTADEAIAKTEAVIAKLRQVRTGLIHDLLTYGLDENGHLRDPVAHREQFQETNLGLLPRAWDVVALGTALSMQAGSGLTGEDISEAGPYAVYGGNGQRGFTSRFTHAGRFVLIGRQGALCGNIAVASGQFFATEHAIVCTPVRPVSAGWLACYLDKMNLNRFSEASAQPGLSVQKISFKQIALPPLDEQVLIETRIDELDRLLESETEELQKLTHLKSGLMDDLLTGRVRVPEIH